LYVTPIWTGLKGLLFEGDLEPKGMPAFVFPLKALVDKGNQVDMLLLSKKIISNIDFNIKAEWIKKVRMFRMIYRESGIKSKFIDYINIYRETKKLCRKHQYDFVYGHGPSAIAANYVANHLNIRYGQRLYGTFFWDDICKYGRNYALLRRHFEHLCFKTRKQFLIVTDDGSNGDKVYDNLNRTIKKPKYEFYFLRNGVNFPTDTFAQFEKNHSPESGINDLFYLARIDEWKRQDRAVEVVYLLKKRGIEVRLLLAGQVSDKAYFEKIYNKSKDLGVEDKIISLGSINRRDLIKYSRESIGALFFYDMCNRGNAFYEVFSSGGIIIANNDGSLNDYIKNEINGFLINSVEEAASVVSKLYQDISLRRTVRMNAEETSRRFIKSWSDRVNEEVSLIENATGKPR